MKKNRIVAVLMCLFGVAYTAITHDSTLTVLLLAIAVPLFFVKKNVFDEEEDDA